MPIQSPFEGIFDEAEHHYLQSEDLQTIDHYVASLPDRISAYRAVRDQELRIAQHAVDQLQIDMPDLGTAELERTLKNGLLSLRYSAMGMLLNDENFVQSRLLNWLHESMQIHNTEAINATFLHLLKQQLNESLTANQMNLLAPFLDLLQTGVPAQEEEVLTAAGMF